MKYEKWLPYGLMVLIAYFTADLIVVGTRSYLLPDKLPAPRAIAPQTNKIADTAKWDEIYRKNIFSRDGKIPNPAGGPDGGTGEDGMDQPAVLSNLPLVLMGTIVHVNPKRSVATIEVKTKNEIFSLRVGQKIPTGGSDAEIVKIERLKVTFRTTRLEYIEIKDDATLRIGVQTGKPGVSAEIEGTETEKVVNRNWLESQLKDLPTILQQAASAPVYDANGKITGFRLLRIQSGSVYERIGVKERDEIQEVNGEKIDSAQKAADLFNTLRNSNSITIGIVRDGRREAINFSIQ